jgi:hypothetical protein
LATIGLSMGSWIDVRAGVELVDGSYFFFGSVLELGSQWSWESYELFVGSSKRQDVSSVVIDSVTVMS